MTNIPDGEKWLWTPAQPDRQAKRQMIALQQLPELIRRVKELERKLEKKSDPAATAEPAPPR
jgi:UDP-3-O-[3-hydroxymyristoyl] glucosamine N-acyltransferase